MRFLLDTDTVSYALRKQGKVVTRLLGHKPSDIGVSAISVAELRYGADRKQSARLHSAIDAFLAPLEVFPFGNVQAEAFGRLASVLAERGTPIGQFDVLIAAHALSLSLTLVTNNVRHFSKVPDLTIENWALPEKPSKKAP
jgi:tRNA(fMet)-specific endonuclease VapC